MITTSVILTWGLCALWGLFQSQSSVDLLATVSRLRTLSLDSVSAFLQIAGPTNLNFKRLETLDLNTVATLSRGADSFNILGDGFKNLKSDSNTALNSTPGPNTPFTPGVQGSLHHSLLHIVLSVFTGIACLLAVYAVYEVIRYGCTGSSSTFEFVTQFKDGILRAGTRIPDPLPTSEPMIILDLYLDKPLAIILRDAQVDGDDTHDASPQDVLYNPLAFLSIRSPTSIPQVNIAVSSPISPFVPPSLPAPPSLPDAVEVTASPRRLVFDTERCDGPAPPQTTDPEPEETDIANWQPWPYETRRSPKPVLGDPFLDSTPPPRPLPPFTIKTVDLHSGWLFSDFYQTPTPAPRPPRPTTYIPSHSGEFRPRTPEYSEDEEVGEFIRFALNMQQDHNTPPMDGYWPGNTTTPAWHPAGQQLRAWRFPRLDLDDPFLDPTPTAPRLLPPFTLKSVDLSSSSLFANEEEDDYQTPTPSPPPLPTTYTRSCSGDFRMPEPDSDEEEVEEFLRFALNMQRDHNAPPMDGYWPENSTTPAWRPSRHQLRAWRLPRLDLDDPFLDDPVPRPTLADLPSIPSFADFTSFASSASFDFDFSDSYAIFASVSISPLASFSSSPSLHAPSPRPASPFTTTLVDIEEDDDQTHVFGIPLFNLNRVPFTHRDPDEDEIDEYNRVALNFPRDSDAVPSTGWLLPSDYDEDWEAFDYEFSAFPGIPIPADMEDPYGEPVAPVDSPWDEDDNKTHVFGIPLAELDRIPCTQRDADDEELNAYICATFGWKYVSDPNAPPSRGWARRSDYDDKLDKYMRTALSFFVNTNVPPSIPADYDEDWVRVDLGTFAFPGIKVPAGMEDPYGEPSAAVETGWEEDDDKTHVFGIPLCDLDRTPFTKRDEDEDELNQYICAAFDWTPLPDPSAPPTRGWWKGSEYDKAKLDEFLRTALTMPLDSTALPSAGWLLPRGHDQHASDLAAYAFPRVSVPEPGIARVPVDAG